MSHRRRSKHGVKGRPPRRQIVLFEPPDIACPKQRNHTRAPGEYDKWIDWAETMKRTHTQVPCTGCGRLVIWERKAAKVNQ